MRTIRLTTSLYRHIRKNQPLKGLSEQSTTTALAFGSCQGCFHHIAIGGELYGCIRQLRAFSSSVSETKRESQVATAADKSEDATTTKSNSTATTTTYGKYQPRPWNHYYEALKAFKAEHNHCNVPQRNKSDPSLAYFVSRQRRLGRDKLTPQQVADLDALGFDWETRAERYERQWNEKLEVLLTYQKEHDTLNVPRRSTYGDGSLGGKVHSVLVGWSLPMEGFAVNHNLPSLTKYTLLLYLSPHIFSCSLGRQTKGFEKARIVTGGTTTAPRCDWL